MENCKGEELMKTINYKQTVEVIENYEVNYTRADFNYDCDSYNIEGITYEELCELLEGKRPDWMITVEEYYLDATGQSLMGPHIVSAEEFFSRILCDAAFEYGCDDRVEANISHREIKIY